MKPEAHRRLSPSCPSPGVLVSVPNFLPGEAPFDASTQHFDDLSRNVYGVMGILAALFMWRVVPETKGRTLEQMEHLWQVPDRKSS